MGGTMGYQFIENMTWKEYQEASGNRILIIPVGATEQHSLHLPLVS
jgi:creatinine amidohydrolase